MDEQENYLAKLRSDLMVMGGVVSAGVTFEDNPNVVEKGSFRTNLTAAEQFLLNLFSTFVITLVDEFKNRDLTAFDQMLKQIAGLFVGLVHGILKLSSEKFGEWSNVQSATDCKAINHSQMRSVWFHFSSYGTGRTVFIYV